MANSYFQFKKFTVWHDRCAMKVGTDGALLGAWADVTDARRILDVGTGSGLVALMLAQRNAEAHVVAVELDENAASQAIDNVLSSPWSDRIQVIQADFNSFVAEEGFDLIVSNPPYFVDSLLSPDSKRATARHALDLTYGDLLVKSASMLRPQGRISLVIPATAFPEMVRIASFCRLHLRVRTDVRTTLKANPKRVLVTFSNNEGPLVHNELIIEKASGTYSEEFVGLLRDFYLKF